jgi:hypothetical protein
MRIDVVYYVLSKYTNKISVDETAKEFNIFKVNNPK